MKNSSSINKKLDLSDLPENSLIVRINQSYREGMSLLELYDITRGCWRLSSPNEKKIEYVISVCKGIIKQVFIPVAWFPAESTLRENYTIDNIQSPESPESKNIRWEFVGRIAQDKQNIVDKLIDFDCGSQNPCIYTNTLLKNNNL